MKRILRRFRKLQRFCSKQVICALPLPLALQRWAIERVLPMGVWPKPLGSWPKCLVYQQCLANRILKRHGATVQSGPLQGMVCIRNADEGCLVPKLLGCYEEELAPVIEGCIQRGYDCIIDVGCASGYWLTGFALRMPRAEDIGFEIDDEAKRRCSKLIALNHVESRVKLLGRCTTDELQELINGRTLVFMDCDGPEYELLDPKLAPALSRADIIVECHDYLNPKIIPTLLERFSGSHSIDRIASRTREPSADRYPGLRALPQEHWAAALDERRPCVQEWLIMHVKEQNTQ